MVLCVVKLSYKKKTFEKGNWWYIEFKSNGGVMRNGTRDKRYDQHDIPIFSTFVEQQYSYVGIFIVSPILCYLPFYATFATRGTWGRRPASLPPQVTPEPLGGQADGAWLMA